MQQFQGKLKLEAMGQLYDILLASGQRTLDYYNPCDWKDGKCRRMRSLKDDAGCCEGCKHLSPKGCTVKSLGCKLWLCEGQRNTFRECEIELEALRQVKSRLSRILIDPEGISISPSMIPGSLFQIFFFLWNRLESKR